MGAQPCTAGEAMGREGRALGQSYAEFLRLRQEGAANIARLERALAACGNCAERSRLDAELSQVCTAESKVRRAEADTLQGMGLGQHDSIQDLVRAMGSALGGKHDFGTDHTRERISRSGEACDAFEGCMRANSGHVEWFLIKRICPWPHASAAPKSLF
jgi:hypothetical protein